MRGRVPVAVLALALVVAGLAARFAVRTLQTARHGKACGQPGDYQRQRQDGDGHAAPHRAASRARA